MNILFHFLFPRLFFPAFEFCYKPAPENIHPFRVASDFSRGEINEQEVTAFIEFVDELQNAPGLSGGCVLIEPSDGAIGETPVENTAFTHRSSNFLIQWEMYHEAIQNTALLERQDDLIADVREKLSRILTGGRYVNYADRLDTPINWWGDNHKKLQAVVAKYDPNKQLISRLWPLNSD